MLAKALADPWTDWQQQVVAVIRKDFHDVLEEVGEDDIDWEAWRPLYEQGCSADIAVDKAFVRGRVFE
jgi:hypothetical protein